MKTKLTPQILGQRLAKLRKKKNLTQVQLSQLIGMSRSSYTQIELGNRSLEVFELLRLAMILEFSIDHILTDHYSIENESNTDKMVSEEEFTYRVSIPNISERLSKIYSSAFWNKPQERPVFANLALIN